MDKTRIAVAVFNKLSKEYQEKFMDVKLYSDGFDLFCDHIQKDQAKLLDIACGPGNITKYLLTKRPDFKITGIDLSANMIALATLNNPQADFQLMDCRDIAMIKKKYDGIICGFCLPYLSKEEALQFITDASTLLNPKGLLYISTMEDEYSKSGFRKGSGGDELFMHYHEADYLVTALEENHFKILQLARKKYHAQDGTNTTDLVIIAEI